MGKSKRQRFTDEFRANAVAAAIAAGYPQSKGALSRTARQLEISHQVLRGWITHQNNPPPQKLLQEKKADLKTLFMNEIYEILNIMPDKRDRAAYSQLGIVLGTLYDKTRLMDGLPTEIVSILPGLIDEMEHAGINVTEAFEQMKAKLKASNANRD